MDIVMKARNYRLTIPGKTGRSGCLSGENSEKTPHLGNISSHEHSVEKYTNSISTHFSEH